MMLRLLASLLVLATVFAAPAFAQSGSRISPFPLGGNGKKPAVGASKSVDISVSYQFFIEGEATGIEEQAKMSEEGRRALYALLGRECAALIETIAEDCTIRRANVSSQINSNYRSRNRPRGVRVSGSATYRITMKTLTRE
ncbi:MAG: hypothetical protein AAFV26_00925 [Pseudomonadota bacterium]